MKVAFWWLLPFVLLGIAGAIDEMIPPYAMPDIGPQPWEAFFGSIACGITIIALGAIFIGIIGGINNRAIDKQYHTVYFNDHGQILDEPPTVIGDVVEGTDLARPGVKDFKRRVWPENALFSVGQCDCWRSQIFGGLSEQILTAVGDAPEWKCRWCGKTHKN